MNLKVKINSKIWYQLPPEVVERIIAFLGCKNVFKEVYRTEFIRESTLDIIRSLSVKWFLEEPIGFSFGCKFSDYLFKNVKVVGELQYKSVIDQEFVRRLFITLLKLDKWEQLYRIFIMSFVSMSMNERKNLTQSVHHELKKTEHYIFNEMKLYAWSQPEKPSQKYLEFESVEDLAKFFICLELRNCLSDESKQDFLYQVWKKDLHHGKLDEVVSAIFAWEGWLHHCNWFVHIGNHLRDSLNYMKRYKVFEKEEPAFFSYFTEVDVEKFKSLTPYHAPTPN